CSWCKFGLVCRPGRGTRVTREVLMRSRLTRGMTLAAPLILVLVAAGCGSSSKSTSTTPAISKAEFLKKGNAICKKGNDQINKAAQKVFPNRKTKQSKAQRNKCAT